MVLTDVMWALQETSSILEEYLGARQGIKSIPNSLWSLQLGDSHGTNDLLMAMQWAYSRRIFQSNVLPKDLSSYLPFFLHNMVFLI